MYHSVATLTPNATIMMTGSNPNLDVTTVKYATEYRVEWLTPSYLTTNLSRPSYTGLPTTVNYNTNFTLNVKSLPSGTSSVRGMSGKHTLKVFSERFTTFSRID